jgi:septal ring factor EnvC (AmiA/AmiB activator)
MMFKLFELDLMVNNSQETQRQTGFKLVGLRRRRQQLQLFQQEQSGLQLEIKSATTEHDALSRQVSALTSIHEMAPLELTVAEAPSAAMQVESSNRTKLFAIALAAIAAVGFGPFILLAFLRALRSTILDQRQRTRTDTAQSPSISWGINPESPDNG